MAKRFKITPIVLYATPPMVERAKG